jgi:hypothetical protein
VSRERTAARRDGEQRFYRRKLIQRAVATAGVVRDSA